MIDASGFVTAGGRSSRMGADKAWLDLGGRPMIEHVIAALEPVTASIAILAQGARYERLGFPVFADTRSGIGPLEAIRTALSHADTTRVVLVGCDLPFVTPELFKLLLGIAGENYLIVPVSAEGKLEPLCAIYTTNALPAVTELIAQGHRRVSVLFERVPTRLVSFEELSHLAGAERFFENVNTPEDYARVSQALRSRGSQNP
jgi:molybdopterin-guanine dinucleotide biosynthesis protein A